MKGFEPHHGIRDFLDKKVVLLDAGRPDEVKKLVATYVISDDTAERFSCDRVMP